MKILVLLLACSAASAQTASNPQTDKAEQVLQRALAALGGPNYLNVKTVTGRGLFTQMKDGAPEAVSEFVDFIAWPDRERTEFKSSAGRFLQVNTGDTGWFFDGRMKAFKDATPEQAAEFKQNLRTTLDSLLRGFWRAEQAALSYAGRREAGLGRRNEVVKLTYPDGFEIEFEFGAQDALPAKTVYRKQNAQGVTGREEDRYAQFVNSGGVLAPFIIDHFREDKQTSRINYNSITFNSLLPADLFAKPATPKAVKWNF